MAPPTRSNSLSWKANDPSAAGTKGILTRGRRTSMAVGENLSNGKRKAASPLQTATKRSALGNITNAIDKAANESKTALKKVGSFQSKGLSKFKDKQPLLKEIPVKAVEKKVPLKVNEKVGLAKIEDKKKSLAKAEVKTKEPAKSTVLKPLVQFDVTSRRTSLRLNSHQPPVSKVVPKTTTSDARLPASTSSGVVAKGKGLPKEPVRSSARLSGRLSLTSEVGEQSLYVSALDISPDAEEVSALEEPAPVSPKRVLPDGVTDFDAENMNDPFQVSEYAMDIFEYLKERESKYRIKDYMERQVCLNRYMRSLLVDWMVEVQENFELNHETLYLAVKIVDTYLSQVMVGKETLQLVGAASIFIASKYDERVPPLVDDLTYICDGAYTHDELIAMEVNILRVIDFDLSMPLSYRFLRRYARCAKLAMNQLTLARYILETSLMDYSTVTVSDSKLAAAALLIALKMLKLGGWTPTLEYYSGYKVEEIKGECSLLNEILHKKPKSALATVRNKYSHKVFFEVANIPLLDDLEI